MNGKKHTILIADDDRNLLKALVIRMESEGHEVLSATDSYQALNIAANHHPDLMLMDINMPAGNGFSVQERLQHNANMNAIPTIYLTGERSQRAIKGAKAAGARAILFKPVDTAELLAHVRSVLGRKTSPPSE